MVVDMPIIGYYSQARFKQFNPSDCANWYLVSDEIGKKQVAMYPCLGRSHVTFQGYNRLIFENTTRCLGKSINYWYNVVDDKIYRVNNFFEAVEITGPLFDTVSGEVFYTYLIAGNITFVIFIAGNKIFVYREDTGSFQMVTDPNAPSNPKYIATFGNRIAVSQDGSSQFYLSRTNLDGDAFDPATCFSFGTMPPAPLFASETGVIKQMGVLQNTLYIFTDFTMGVWNNIPTTLVSEDGSTTSSFPWKKNTTYDWDFGIAFANSLDIDYGMMTWVSKNRNGLIQIMSMTAGQEPQTISDQGINVLLQSLVNAEKLNPFNVLNNVDGFLYDYENTIHYRLSNGEYTGTQLLDQISTAYSIEYNYDSKKWSRCIEKNGERCRVQKHVFFADRHLVSVLGNNTIYELSGEYYFNDIENSEESDPQAPDAYIQEPFRYERVTSIIVAGLYPQLKSPGFYAELKTNYVEIDMVWGIDTFYGTQRPIIWQKPHVELYYSNDGGISFFPADVLEISEIGKYQWRMRWYQLGCHRNRVYKLICVSTSPIVILGGVMEVSNVSGGAA